MTPEQQRLVDAQMEIVDSGVMPKGWATQFVGSAPDKIRFYQPDGLRWFFIGFVGPTPVNPDIEGWAYYSAASPLDGSPSGNRYGFDSPIDAVNAMLDFRGWHD